MVERKSSRTIVVKTPEGLHARPAELFAKIAMQFDAKIEVIKEGHRADAKSILSILTLAAVQGTTLTLEAVGQDADIALEALVELAGSDFSVDGTLNQNRSS